MKLLGRAEIEARSGEIFHGGRFEPEYLRPAVYDLRVEVDPDADEPTGRVSGGNLILGKGQRAVLRTYEAISMPWDLAGNIGVKHGQAAHGLFVSGGLFIDPGFGWSKPAGGEAEATGDHIRVLATNLGRDPIPIRLGAKGDPVLGIQFIEVEPPLARTPVIGTPIDTAQGLAFFEDLELQREKSEAMGEDIEWIEAATDRVVVFGVFLVSATLVGAIVAFILALLGSGHLATNTVHALNGLDAGKPWTVVLMVSLTALAIACTAWMALAAKRAFLDVWSKRRPRRRDRARPGAG